MKTTFFSRLLILAMLILSGIETKAQCNSAWQYVVPVKVTNTTSDGFANFQVKISVNTAALISAGKMQSTGADIRFADASCNNLSYWIENGTINTSSTSIWVKTLSMPANATQTIYMYYGNASATAGSNGDATFDLFEDFTTAVNLGGSLGTVPDTSKWTSSRPSSTGFTISGGIFKITTTLAGSAGSIYSKKTFSSAITFETKVTAVGSTVGGMPGLGIFNNGGFFGYSLDYNTTSGNMELGSGTGCSNAWQTSTISSKSSANSLAGTWGIQWPSTGIQKGIWPGGTISTTATDITIGNKVSVAIGALCSGKQVTSFDWARVRKYASAEPGVTNGPELSNLVAITSLTGPFCVGSSISVPYTISGTFNSGNVFTAEISDSSGSFTSATTIGSVTSTSSGTISATLPAGVFGNHFALRVKSSSPAYVGISTDASVIISNLPSANPGSSVSICAGSSTGIGVNAVSGNIYSWSSSPADNNFNTTSSNPTVSPVQTTVYTLTETNAYTCSATNSVTVTVNSLPAAVAGSNQTILQGSSVTLGGTAVSGSTYSWSDGNSVISTSANPTVSPSAATTYTVTETNSNNCSASNSVTITVNPLSVSVSGGPTTFCQGGSVTLSATAPSGVSYQWYDSNGAISGATSSTYTATTSDGYYVVVTNGSASASSTGTLVTVNALPAASVIGNTSVCKGNSVNIGATAVSGSTYSWSDGNSVVSTDANPTVNPSGTTTYTLTETNTAGCTASNSVTVTVNSLPAANAGSNQTVVIGNSTTIGAAAVSGSTYSWTSNPAGFTSTSANPTVSPTATTTYTVEETNAAGCTATNSVTITAVNPCPSKPTVTPSDATTFCAGGSITLTASCSAANATYSWSNQNGPLLNANGQSITVTSSGTYYVTATVSSCSKTSDGIQVTVNPVPVASISAASSYYYYGYDNCPTLNGSSSISGSTYSWSTGATTQNITVCPKTTDFTNHKFTYSLTVTKNGCTSIAAKFTLNVLNVQCHDEEEAHGNQNKDLDKFQMCHNGTDICVAKSAVPAHLKQGDAWGDCCNGLCSTLKKELVNKINVYPNPFSNITTISVMFAQDAQASVEVLGLDGKLISNIYNGQVILGSPYSFTFDGSSLKSGIYIVRVISGEKVEFRKISLVK
jgi:hypothetical protein